MTSKSQTIMQSFLQDKIECTKYRILYCKRRVRSDRAKILSIFYPPAVYQKVAIVTKIKEESFFSSFKVLAEEGYLKVAGIPKKKASQTATKIAVMETVRIIIMIQMTRQVPILPIKAWTPDCSK